MVSELFPIVSGNRMNKGLRSKHPDFDLCDVCSTFAHDFSRYSNLLLPLYDRHQRAAVTFTNNSIDLQVAYSRSIINNSWALIHANSLNYLAPGRFPIAPFVIFLNLLT